MSLNHEYFMREALELARLAAQRGEVPVGALVVQDEAIIARAHNETESRTRATAHAEVLAIEQASASLKRWRLEDCRLYVTLEPCPMCIGAILLARIPEIYFAAFDPRMGAVGSRFDLSAHEISEGRTRAFSGILAEESESLLHEFFQARRR